MKALFFFGFMLILFSAPVHAQQVAEAQDMLGGVWNAIYALQDDVQELHDQLSAFHQQFLQFKNNVINHWQDVNATIGVLEQNDISLQNQITATNVQVQENTDSINVHTQELDDLNQTTEALNQTNFSLQTQISDNNNSFTNYATQTDVHIQTLEANDANLQQQINGISNVGFSRNDVYFVANTSPTESVAFCEDNTDILLFGYCSGKTLGDVYYPETALYDGFDDYGYTSNPTWNLVYGNLGVGDSTAGILSGKLYTIPTFGEISTPIDIMATQVSMSARVRTHGGNNGEFGLALTDKEGPWGVSNENGYLLYTRINGGNSSFSFAKFVNGVGLDIYNSPTFPLNGYTDYVTRAERDNSGYWRFYINDIQSGPAVYDDTFQTFTFAHIRLNGAYAVADDINITSTGYNPSSSSAILNIDDLNAPMGVQCKVNGSARVLCLRVE